MPSFRYEIRKPDSSVDAGIIEAGSLTEATDTLRARGGYLLDVSRAGGSEALNILDKMRSVSIEAGPGLKDVLNFTNQLAVMIKAGINIRNAIDGIAQQVDKPKFRRIIEQIKADVESGQPFSEALAKHPKVFSPLYVNMVRASELSGNFGQMLKRIAEYIAQQVETRSMVRGAMVYPAIIAFMAVSTTIFLLTWVLPRFTALFAGKEDLLPKPTLMLVGLSEFMRANWYMLLAGTVALAVGFRYAIRTRSGAYYWDVAKLRIPLFCRMFRALYINRSLQTMGELVNAGVPMPETLSITADVSGNTLYRNMWQRVHKSVTEGEKIVSPLSNQTLLPRNVVQMISAGEESGNLGDVLRDIASFYGRELRDTIKAVTSMIEPLMIILMGLLVGFIAMSIILPIFKMSSLVSD